MNVLTLSSSDDVKAVTVDQLQTKKYDKIVINGVKDLDSTFYNSFSKYAPEIEAVDCTLIDDHSTLHVNNCKCAFKNTKSDDGFIHFISDSSTIVIDGWPGSNNRIEIKATKGVTNFSLLNGKSTNVYFMGDYNQFGTITFSNCSKIAVRYLPLRAIPDTDTSVFMAQFESLSTIAGINMIDANNYKIIQADWDKAIDLLNQYPPLLEDFHLNCDMVNKHSSNVYYHIPSLTFPLPWINSLLALGHISKFDMTISSVLLNKNDKPNFTITHASDVNNSIQPKEVPFLIADNYNDVVKSFTNNFQIGDALTYGRYYHNQSMLSGKLATSEITLIANSLFAILTIDQNMQKHVTKIKTGIHGKTMKITSMEPFGALKVFATKANDLTGEFIVPSVVSEDLIGVVAVNQIQKDISGSIGVPLITAHDFDGTINIATLTQETNIYGIITTMPAIRVSIDGSMDIQTIVTQELNGTANIAIPAQDASIEGSMVILGIQKYITGKISIPSVTVTEIDGTAVIKHQVEKEFDGEINIKVCRAEILGSLEIPIAEEVNG